MRASIVAAIFAGVVMANEEPESTLYTTKYYTKTQCPSTVTDCPATVTSSVIPLTTSTVYTTRVHTITSCAPEVTKCPAHSTIVVTETEAAYTTVCPVGETHVYSNSTVKPTYKPTHTKPVETEVETMKPTYTKPSCPTYSVKTISTSITTVIPTVIYETVSVPCPTVKPSPTYGSNTT